MNAFIKISPFRERDSPHVIPADQIRKNQEPQGGEVE